ncbi:MAG: ABC transporter substrate-binding protein [Firmicutes bacterium]|jgi:peptide/nickel transport system substrate-binding protein|nr:ABC transporter substrate-binding protein [Bacillota bacterium]NLL88266.1 ABC transporter substrate-binding protein [Bacillota bacterium]HKM16931.1 ABC transporter substrate-binding protein [Limnochordia bacterium]
MNAKMRTLLVLLLVVAVGAGVYAYFRSRDQGETTDEGRAPATDPNTFVYVTIGEPDTLDPAYAYDTASGEIIHQLYDTLFDYNGSSLEELVPRLAAQVPSIENGLISEDGRTIKVPIRKSVKFHNGSDLTPEDVEYTFERAMISDPVGSPIWMFFEPLLGVQTMEQVIALAGGPSDYAGINEVDPAIRRKAFDMIDAAVEVEGDAVVFNLAAPYPPFLQILAKGGSWSSILDKEWMIANGDWDGNPDTWAKWHDPAKEEMTLYEKANGTGPFRLQAWDRSGGQIVLKRFDDYYRGAAKLETVFVKYIEEYNTRLLMLQSGDADAIYADVQYLDQLKGIDGVKAVEGLQQIANTTLLYNFTIPYEGNEDIVGSGKLDGNGIPSDFFADINVRRAFNYAFDYERYLNEVANGAGSIAKGFIPAALPFSNKDGEWFTHDLEQAEQFFRQAFDGELWDKGFKLTLLYNSGNNSRKTAAEILEFNIESINPKFQIDVQGMQWPTYLSKLDQGSLPVFFMGWLMDFPDAHNFVDAYLRSTGAFAGYCGEGLVELAKAEFDGLIAQAMRAQTTDERAALYQEINRKAFEFAVSMPYIEPSDHRVMRAWVQGFAHNPAYSANYDFYSLTKNAAGS